MPRLEAKIIQKELDSGKLRPVYWIYGPERMKSRELMKRILKAALGDQAPNDFNFEKQDGSEVGTATILDAAQGFSLMGGTKVILVRNAEDLKQPEMLADYFESIPSHEPVEAAELSSVVVFISKNFDSRKKTSKKIQELVATIPCEEVTEQDREPWIAYLAKRRGITLTPEEQSVLRGLDPWSLEIVDQELAKLELVGNEEELRKQVLLSGIDAFARDDFIDALFCRDSKRVLKWMHLFCEDIDVQLPILGLVSWNLRHLKLLLIEEKTRSRSGEKRNPYLQRNLDRWKRFWTLDAIQEFEHGLFEIDFSLKNTPLIGKGLWTSLIFQQ
jgi:DNA polymerase III delta subunit